MARKFAFDVWKERRVGCFQLALPILMVFLLQGCLFPTPIVPFPDIVYVPHPDAAKPDLSSEDLLDLYSASPNRDPDGLGVLDTIWLQSKMVLNVWEIERDKEIRNKIAFARSDEKHAKIMEERKAFFSRHVVFKGILIAWDPDYADPEWYLPEGVYAVDDKGKKFSPLRVERGPMWGYYERSFVRTSEGTYTYLESAHFIGYPIIVFPKTIVSAETRSITLFYAARQQRMSFTWVFDPEYRPKVGVEVPGVGNSANPLWPRKQ